MNFELIAGLAGLWGAMFIIYHIIEMFRGVKMGGIGPIANPFERRSEYKPLLMSPDWLNEKGRLRITRRNPNAVGGVSVSIFSGWRRNVNWNDPDIIDIQDAEE